MGGTATMGSWNLRLIPSSSCCCSLTSDGRPEVIQVLAPVSTRPDVVTNR
jgi:hypothetical protein